MLCQLVTPVPALVGHRVVHFVSNQGGLAALVGGFDTDTSAIACVYQLVAAPCSVRAWFEYVESEAKIADGPSREGRRSSYVARAIHCTMEGAALPDLPSLGTAPLTSLGAFPVARAAM